jgi:acetyl esterase
MARASGRADVGYQILEVPVLDLTHSLPREEGEHLPLSMPDVRTFSALYLGSKRFGQDPLASPLLAPDLRRLPPAYIAVAEYDVLCGDGERYAQRLRDAGVPVDFYVGRGQVHISPSMTRLLSSARDWRKAVTEALRGANTRLLAPSVSSREAVSGPLR